MPEQNDFAEENEPQQDNSDEKSPRFIQSQMGRTVSLRGLVERIVEEYHIEHGENESDAAQAADTPTERRKLVKDVANYIFSVESVQLILPEQARIISNAYGELFGYGPLDELLTDETVTTISLEGVDKAAIRYAPGTELVKFEDPLFEDLHHFRTTLKRMLYDAGAELRPDIPIIETGLTYEGRRVSISVVAPPFVTELAADIRVHPKEVPTLQSLVDNEVMPQKAHDLLVAIAKSEHGFIIVGDTESGKTTLLSMLLQDIPNGDNIVTVERASELAVPEGATQYQPKWQTVHDSSWVTFGERIQEALDRDASTIVLDEVRADEPETIMPLLDNVGVPRQIWSMRGASDASRIRSALGTLARMSNPAAPEAMVFQLYERLPFVIIVKRRRGYLQLLEIAEWQFPDGYQETNDFVYADYIALMEMGWEGCQMTGRRPKRDLDLHDDFWE